MKKLLLSILFIVLYINVFSQVTPQQIDVYKGVATGTNSYSVTIGGTNNPSSPYLGQTIKVKSNANSGSSTLKVNNYSAKAITQNGSALIGGEISANTWIIYVYDTASGGQWQIQHGSSGSAGWNLTGNSGTTMSNFLGTTDNKTMYVRTNNTPHFNFDSLGRVLIYGSTVLTDPSTTGLLLGGNSSNGYIQSLSPGRGDLILNGVGNLVGVGLSLPKATFHVKYQGLAQDSGYIFRFDNNTSTNLFNLSNTGTLTLTGQLKVVNGTQGANKVLTDVSGTGLGTWQTPSGVSSVNAGTDITITGASTPTISVIPNPTFAISTTTPILIGGTTTTSTITYRPTSGAGTTGADQIWQVGNNGATEAMRLLNSGNLGIGTNSATATLEVAKTGTLVSNYTFIARSTNGVLKLRDNGNIEGGSTTVNNILLFGIGTSTVITGQANTAFGNTAMSLMGGGQFNTAFGSNALQKTVGGNFNTAIGSASLLNNTGSANTATGYNSLGSNTSGGNGSAFGQNALAANTTGTDNSAFGVSCLPTITTGLKNSAFGELCFASNVSGSNNIGFGYTAGRYEMGSNSLYVNSIDRVNTAGDKALSIIYGVQGATPSVQTLQFNSSVGINSTIGTGTGLVVNGFGADASTYAWTTANSTGIPFLYARNDNRLGIGQSAPSTNVQISGSGGLGGQLYINTSSGFPGICMGNNTSMASASHQAMFGMAIAANDYAFGTALGDGITNSKGGKLAFVLGASTGTGGVMQANINTTGLIVQNTDGTTATAKLQTIGNGSTNSTNNLKLSNSSLDTLLLIRDDGTTTGKVMTSGLYSPTVSGITNVSSITANISTTYMRIVNIVTAQYSLLVTPSVTLTNTVVRVSLPLTANPSGSLSGQGVYQDTAIPVPAYVNPTDGTHCDVNFTPVGGGNFILNFSISYRIN